MKVYKLFRIQSRGNGMHGLEVEVNGKKGRFLVDTGSDICGFSPEFVEKLGLREQIKPFGFASGAAPMALPVLGAHAQISVLGKTVDRVLVFGGVSLEYTKDGLIGMDVLGQYRTVTFDNEKNELRLED